MEIKDISTNGIQFLINEEGLIKRPYRDSVGIPTIGVGMTYYPINIGKHKAGDKVKMTDDPLTTAEAVMLFKYMLKAYELAVYSTTRDDLNHNMFDALVSLTYNIGTVGFKNSTLRQKVNANLQDKAGIEAGFLMWRKAGGNPILLSRRKREVTLFFAKETTLTADDEYVVFVKNVQSKLGLPADGIFGKNTKAAVIAFQKKNGLVTDGIVGPQTLAKLNKNG